MPNKLPLDPNIIEQAPVEVGPITTLVKDLSEKDQSVIAQYQNTIGEYSEEIDTLKAEIERLKGEKTYEQIRAELLKPYASKVYWFVVWYCVVVAIFLISAGDRHITGFQLSDTILGIIAGSTAVAVIGLIGMVVSGLFGSSPKAKK